MPVKTIVRDYLAVQEAKILIDGLTILKGESFQGKSSFVSALRAAFTNTFATTCVRWGAPAAEVKVLFPDGKLFHVKRPAKGSTALQFDGQSYEKIGRDIPEAVAEYLGIKSVSLGADSYNLNFYDQFQPPLLLACSHKRLADMLSASGALADYNLLTKALASRRDELKGAFATLDGLMAGLKTQLGDKRLFLERAEPVARELLQAYRALEATNNRHTRAGSTKVHIDEKERKANHLKAATDAAEAIDTYTRLETDNATLADVLHSMGRVVERRHRLSLEKEALTALGELGRITERNERATETIGMVERRQDHKDHIAFIRKMVESYKQAEGAFAELQTLQSRKSAFDTLKSYLQHREVLQQRIETNKKRLETDTCPLCGSKLNEIDDMTHEEIIERRQHLEALIRQDEQDIAVLDSKIADGFKALGLTNPTKKELDDLCNKLSTELNEQERVVATKLSELEELEHGIAGV